MRKLFVILLSLLVIASDVPVEAFPSSFTWTFAGTGGGGHFPYIYPDPSVTDKFWAMSDVSGILKSTDDGDNWLFSTSGLLNVGGSSIIQAPSSATTFYHASGTTSEAGEINSSTDSGVTWTSHGIGTAYRLDRQSHKALAVKLDDASTAYLGNTTGDIYRTTNRTTWSQWKTAAQVGIGHIDAMVVDKTNTYLWVGSTSGLRRITIADGTVATVTLTSTNGTRNTDLVATTIAGTNYIFASAGNKIAYTTTNSTTGSAWTYSADTGISSSYAIERFDVAPGASLGATKILLAYQQIGNFFAGARLKSSNGGSSWSSVTSTVTFTLNDNPSRAWHTDWLGTSSIKVDPNNSNRWFGSDDWGIFRTDDFGTTWAEKVKGAGNTVMSDIRIAPDGSIIASMMDAGLIRSTDGGTSWKMLFPDNSSYDVLKDGHVWKISCLGTQTQWNNSQGVIVATLSPWTSGSYAQKIIRSTNQGGSQSNAGTWSVITNSGIPNVELWAGIWGRGYPRAMAVDPNDNGTSDGNIWLGIDGVYDATNNGGIWLSTDAGQTFTRKTTQGAPASTNYGTDWRVYNGLAVNPTDSTNIIYASFSSGIFYSTNSGTNWTYVATSLNSIFDVKFGTDGTAYAVGVISSKPAVWRSTNKGVSWTQIWISANATTYPGDGLEVDPSNAARVVVSEVGFQSYSPNKVYMSENANTAVAANVSFTDITGNLPDGQGMATCAFRTTEGSAGFLYCGRYAGSLYKIDLSNSSIGALTSASVTPGSLVQSTANTTTIAFTTATAIPSDGKIKVTFPNSLGSGFSFNSGGTSAAGSLSGIDGNLTVSIASNIVTFTRSAGTSSAAGAKSFTLSRVLNPNTTGSTGTFSISTTNSSDTVLDQNTSVSAVTITAPPAQSNNSLSGTYVISGTITLTKQ